MALPPADCVTLQQGHLTSLKAFKGTLPQLEVLPQSHPSLERLELVSPIDTTQVSPSRLAETLAALPRLKDLSVQIIVEQVSSVDMLNKVAKSCPLLEDLDFSISGTAALHLVSTDRLFPLRLVLTD
jgi:hypothetical protein